MSDQHSHGSRAKTSRPRLVRRDDAGRLRALFGLIDDPMFHPHPLTYEAADEIVDYQGRDVYAVLEGDNGALMAYGLLRGWDEGYEVPSLGIAVRRDQRRRGYGRQMMGWLADEARRRGAHHIRLRVSAMNTSARSLYASLGYREAGEERGELVMQLDLDRS